jgi:hypothetical protein
MAIGDLVYANKSFTYGGQALDRLQVVKLKGLLNDESMLRHGHFVPVPDDVELFKCGICGAEFVAEAARTVHGNNRHPDE